MLKIRSSILKKGFAIFIAICFTLSSFGSVFAAPASDIAGNWAEPQIRAWMDQGYISGYPDGRFKPSNSITRAELIALINKSFGFTEKKDVAFKDVSSKSWVYSEVLKANAAGYISGYGNDMFGPGNKISRQELAVMIKKLLNLKPSADAGFTDMAAVPAWGKDAVNAVQEKGIMQGFADHTFRPSQPASRAEAVVILDRALALFHEGTSITYTTAGVYGPETGNAAVGQDVVIDSKDVTLRNTTISGNLLLGAGIGEGDVQLENVTVKGTTTVSGGGANSVHFNKSTLGNVIVDKKKGSVRVVAEGSTTVGNLQIQSAAAIESVGGAQVDTLLLSKDLPSDSKVSLKGSYKAVNVDARNVNVEIPEGTIQSLTVSKEATGNKLKNEAAISSLDINAGLEVTGKGKIDKAVINAVGISLETAPTKLEAGKDSSADVKVKIGGVEQPAATPAPVVIGGGPSGPLTPPVTTPDVSGNVQGSIKYSDGTMLGDGTVFLYRVEDHGGFNYEVKLNKGKFGVQLPDGDYYINQITTDGMQELMNVRYNFTVHNGTLGSGTIQITLPPKVTGTFKYPNDETINEGIISFNSVDSNPFDYNHALIHKGSFNLYLPDGKYQVSNVYSSDNDEDISIYHLFEIKDGLLTSPLTVTLPAAVTGTIKDSENKAITSGRIGITRINVDTLEKYYANIKDGNYTFYIPKGDYQVTWLSTEKYEMSGPSLNFSFIDDPLDIVMPKLITGTISYADGRSFVGDGYVMFENATTKTPYSSRVTNGQFSVCLPDGDYVISNYVGIDGEQAFFLSYSFKIDKDSSEPTQISLIVPLNGMLQDGASTNEIP
ncbi:S-layer homology domain-containing protein [Paenibacillus sp. NFR01]|uniref:S-layer homology domain-containing protein n=1 Tax=Paenibacillus sp. NFR01 TaxID=1566279 RepID=UPI0008B78321|nr:S-layer homology domain-containing protein [Paenibacillus sp. NFR01]SES90097.1 S-layer homology domain-containing protein [Paenibacillus sp. NFR01]